MIQFLVILAFLLGVVFFITAPFRRPQAEATIGDGALLELARDARLLELEAAREAKYREIRDAELDHQTGKLSDDDYLQLDATLRAEALEILNALDRASG